MPAAMFMTIPTRAASASTRTAPITFALRPTGFGTLRRGLPRSTGTRRWSSRPSTPNWPNGRSPRITSTGKWAQLVPAFKGIPSNFEEAALALMPRQIYEQFVQQYNEKQWGVPARALPADLCRRFDVRRDDDPRLKPGAKYQGIPKPGYAAWMRQLLDGIRSPPERGLLAAARRVPASKWLIFTGPIDEYFGFDLGRLKYRGQRRSHTYLPDIRYAQPCGQVNNPLHAGGPHIRTLEWKHMMDRQDADRISGTVLTQEVPCTPNHPTDYEYPFPGDANSAAYRAYRARAEVLENSSSAAASGNTGTMTWTRPSPGRWPWPTVSSTVGRRLVRPKSLVTDSYQTNAPSKVVLKSRQALAVRRYAWRTARAGPFCRDAPVEGNTRSGRRSPVQTGTTSDSADKA